MYAYACVCVYANAYICACVDVHAHVHRCVYAYVRIHIQLCICIRACVSVCIRKCASICICTHTPIHTYIHTYTLISTHIRTNQHADIRPPHRGPTCPCRFSCVAVFKLNKINLELAAFTKSLYAQFLLQLSRGGAEVTWI